MSKVKKRVWLEEVVKDDVDLGNLACSISYLQALQQELEGEGYRNLRMEVDEFSVRLYGRRMETDTEYSRRLKRIEKQKEKSRESERKTLRRLMNKYPEEVI